MELLTLFIIAGIVVFIGFLAEWVFEKTNIPDVIWLIILGVVIGHFFKITENPAFLQLAPLFSTFALIFILFDGALNIDIKKLFKGVSEGGSMAFIYFVLSSLIISLAMMAAGWQFLESLLLGTMLGGISSDLIIPLAKKLTIKPETSLNLTLEAAISDVFSVIGTITILNLLVLDSFSFDFAIKKLVNSFAIALFIGTVFGIFWVKIQEELNKFEKSYMITIAAVLLLYSFVEYMESNGAIACLAFGIILGNSNKIFSIFDKQKEYKVDQSEKFFFGEISFFVKTFFFVYLGLIVTFTSLPYIALGFLISLILYLIRPLAYSIVYGKREIEPKDRAFMEIVTPRGLAAAVLAQFPLRYGLPHGTEFPVIVIYVILFTILSSTLGVFLVEKANFKGLGGYIDLRKLGRREK